MLDTNYGFWYLGDGWKKESKTANPASKSGIPASKRGIPASIQLKSESKLQNLSAGPIQNRF